MVDAQCSICGKIYRIPDGRGRGNVESRFLHHKDACHLPREDEFIRASNRVGIVVEVHQRPQGFPLLTVQFPSGRMRDYGVSEVVYLEDQERGKEKFYE